MQKQWLTHYLQLFVLSYPDAIDNCDKDFISDNSWILYNYPITKILNCCLLAKCQIEKKALEIQVIRKKNKGLK